MEFTKNSTFAEVAAYHRNSPRAKNARVRNGILEITLATGATLSVPARQLRHLTPLTDEQLNEVRVVAGGTGLMWRSADVDLSVDGLLRALTGLKIDPARTKTLAPSDAARAKEERDQAKSSAT